MCHNYSFILQGRNHTCVHTVTERFCDPAQIYRNTCGFMKESNRSNVHCAAMLHEVKRTYNLTCCVTLQTSPSSVHIVERLTNHGQHCAGTSDHTKMENYSNVQSKDKLLILVKYDYIKKSS